MLKKIKKRTREDKGNATIILGIMLLFVLFMVGGMMLDFSKAHQLKSSYIDAARKSTQSAVMVQNSKGYLKPEAIGKAIGTYENIARPAVVNRDGYFSKCANYNENNIRIEVQLSGKSMANQNFSILRKDVMRINKIDPAELKKAETAINNRITSTMKSAIQKGKYTSIKLTVTEGTENSVLPIGFSFSKASKGDIADMKCQKLIISEKATKFIGAEGKYN